MPIQISLSNAIGALQGLAGGGPGPGPGPGYTPPLDAFGGAVAAFSVRKLSSSYSGFCCQVTRTSDSATLDVPFTSSGLIDIEAINTFDDGGGVLLTTWYDQTSSGNDFSGGVGISTLEEKPGLNGGGAGLTNSGVTIPADFTLVTLNKYQNNIIYFGGSGNTFFNYAVTGNDTNLRYRILGNTRDFTVNGRSGTEINVGTRTSGALQVRHQGNISTTPIAYNGSFPIDFLAKFNIYHQEYIIYNSSLTEPETLSLTQNLNSYYQVTNLPDFTSGFLADYPDAAAAYSVRKLSNTAIKCMRVRRAVAPFDEKDIGFTAGGDLDEAAIVAFGGSDVLLVSAWYDQSGQSRHATQINPNSQPQIYNGTAVITENGKAALDFISNSGRSLNGPTFSNNSIMGFCVSREVVRRGTIWGLGGGLMYETLELTYWDSELLLVFKGDGTNYDSVRSPTLTDDNAQHLVTLSRFSNALKTFVDGTADINTTDSYSADSGALGFATRNTQGQLLLQEAIFYETDQDTAGNRTGIETNIDDYYKIIVNDEAATSGFLFDYPNAAVAYSVRQLNNNAEFAMQIERSDGRTKKIGFDGNGDLDTQAIIDFAGASVATIKLWYDQSGAQNHATRFTSTDPPQIYDGSSIISVNGNPAIYAPTAVTRMAVPTQTLTNPSVLCVYELSTGAYPINDETAQKYRLRFFGGRMYLYLDGSTIAGSLASAGDHTLHTFYDDGATVYWRTNGGDEYTRAFTGSTRHERIIGNLAAGMKFQEYILFDTNKYSDRTGIESDTMTYYDIT
jgi:hypothetical protein